MTDVPFSSYERHATDTQPVAAESRRPYTTALLLLLLAVLLFAWYSLTQRDQRVSQPAQPTAETISPPASTAAGEAVGSESATRTARAERPRTAAPQRSSAPERILALSPAPAYPAQALRRGEGGTVVLRVNVGADGRPTDIAFADRSHSRELDRAARDAVAKWQFTPATRDGKAVAAVVEVPVDFKPQQ